MDWRAVVQAMRPTARTRHCILNTGSPRDNRPIGCMHDRAACQTALERAGPVV